MKASRRSWLRQVGLGIAGMSLSPLQGLALTSISGINDDSQILLRSNENPYGPSPLALKAMAEKINSCNRYCWDLDGQLISAIAQKNGVSAENILVGAGSTEILNTALRLAALQRGHIILAEPTYNY